MVHACTHRAQSYRGGSKPNETAISGMRLVDGIGILVAELRDDTLDPVIVICLERFADQAFKLQSAAFPLVVELVVEGFCDIGVHVVT